MGARARYRLSYAKRRISFPEHPGQHACAAGLLTLNRINATLHQGGALRHLCPFQRLLCPSGGALGFRRRITVIHRLCRGTNFWQANAFIGYRFPQTLRGSAPGHPQPERPRLPLNPLNLTTELPRTRTLVAAFKFHF